MAADILRIHVDETLTTIKQTFDDRSVSQAQVAYCYIVASNQLLSQHNAKRNSGAFLTVFDNIPINVAGQSGVKNTVKDRKFIELPGLIFDYDKDDAVEYLAYTSDGGPNCPPRFTRTPFTRTDPSQAQWLYLHPQTTPSPKNPYFFRVGNLIYTLGLEGVPITHLEGGFYMTIDPLNEIDLDAPFNFPQELMQTLKRLVIDLIRYNWFFPKDKANEGTDDSGKANIPKVVSVNDQQPQQ
jgi:hypothetical protein